VQLGPNGSYVYKVQADDTVQMQAVTVGQTEGNLAMITGGLAEGDKVVVDGQSRLQPGSKVQVSAPAADAGSGSSSGAASSGGPGQPAGGAAAQGADLQNAQHQGRHRHKTDQDGSSSSSSGGSDGGASGGKQ